MTLLIIAGCSVLAGVILSIISLMNSNRGTEARYLAFFIGSASLWVLGPITSSIYPSIWSSRLVFVLALIMTVFLFMFVTSILKRDLRTEKLAVLTLSAVLVPVIMFTDLVVSSISLLEKGSVFYTLTLNRGGLYPVVAVWIVSIGLVSAILLTYAVRLNRAYRILQFSFFAGILVVTATNVIMPSITKTNTAALYAFAGQIIWSIGFTVYSLKHLSSSNKSLTDANQTMDEFIAVASHQLRTPLAIASICHQNLLEDTDLGEVQARHVEIARDSVERMTSIIEVMLDSARYGSRAVELDLERVDLSIQVVTLTAQYKELANKNGLELRVIVNDKECFVLGDKIRLNEALSVLIDNAIKYSGDGRSIDVHLARSDRHVVVLVKDRGAGVHESDQERIFEKFSRTSNAHNSNPDGLGLGLYITGKIVEQHGGEVLYLSRKGGGSTFGFKLPLE